MCSSNIGRPSSHRHHSAMMLTMRTLLQLLQSLSRETMNRYTYSVWPKVSNQHGGNIENLKPKSTTEIIVGYTKNNKSSLKRSALCRKLFTTYKSMELMWNNSIWMSNNVEIQWLPHPADCVDQLSLCFWSPWILPRNAMLVQCLPSLCVLPSVCLSITCRYLYRNG